MDPLLIYIDDNEKRETGFSKQGWMYRIVELVLSNTSQCVFFLENITIQTDNTESTNLNLVPVTSCDV